MLSEKLGQVFKKIIQMLLRECVSKQLFLLLLFTST